MVGSTPRAAVRETVRDLHGERVVDPYGWMHDQSSPEFLQYLIDEREYFDRASSPWSDVKEELISEFQTKTSSGSLRFSWQVGEFEYAETTEGKRSFPALTRRHLVTGRRETVLEQDAVADGHEHLRLGVLDPSPDGKWLAYSVDVVGGEAFTLHFRNLESGVDEDIAVPRTYYGGAWAADSSSFFYVVLDEAHRPYQVQRHVVGANTADDVVFEEEDEHFFARVYATRNGEWLVISSESRDTAEQYVLPAAHPNEKPRLFSPREKGVEYFVEHRRGEDGGRFVILTNHGAPEYRVVSCPVSSTDREHWENEVAELPGTRIQRVDVFQDHLVLSCYRSACPVLRVVGPDGSFHEIGPDDENGALHFEGPADYSRASQERRTAYTSPDITVVTQSLVQPPRWYRVDLEKGSRTLVAEQQVSPFESGDYLTSRHWVDTEDGVRVPVTLAHHRSVRPDGRNGCLLSAYGAYERTRPPLFSSQVLSLLDRGVVYAIAHVRGGGEMGRHWWLDGRLTNKRNTIDDFQAVSDWMVRTGWAAPRGIVPKGDCAGAITTSAVYTFDPEKWAGVIAGVAAVDLINSMLDTRRPLTVNEWDEWGDPRDLDIYTYMRSYVAYENISDRPRPPLLVTGTFRDTRALVNQQARWVASLRACDTHRNLILFRVTVGDGAHHGPSQASASLAHAADIYAFAIEAMSRAGVDTRLRGASVG